MWKGTGMEEGLEEQRDEQADDVYDVRTPKFFHTLTNGSNVVSYWETMEPNVASSSDKA